MQLKTKHFLLCCLFFSVSAAAQLKPGDSFIEANSTIFVPLQKENGRYNLSGHSRYIASSMIRKRLMLGLGVATRTNGFQNSDNIPRIYTSVFLRRYFGIKKWAPFILLNIHTGSYQNNYDSGFVSEYDSGFGLGSDLGLGLTIHLAKNVYWEAILRAPFIGRNFSESNNILELKNNLRIAFHKNKESPPLSLQEELLRPGCILFNGNLSLQITGNSVGPFGRFSDDRFFLFDISTTYFITRYTSANAALGVYGLGNNSEKELQSTIGLSQYFLLTNSWFLSVQGQLKSTQIQNPFFPVNYLISSFPLAVNVHYFKNRSQYYAGVEYARSIIKSTRFGITEKEKAHALNSYLGMDFYLTKSVLLQQKLSINWQTNIVPDDFSTPRLKTGFGVLGYSLGFVIMI